MDRQQPGSEADQEWLDLSEEAEVLLSWAKAPKDTFRDAVSPHREQLAPAGTLPHQSEGAHPPAAAHLPPFIGGDQPDQPALAGPRSAHYQAVPERSPSAIPEPVTVEAPPSVQDPYRPPTNPASYAISAADLNTGDDMLPQRFPQMRRILYSGNAIIPSPDVEVAAEPRSSRTGFSPPVENFFAQSLSAGPPFPNQAVQAPKRHAGTSQPTETAAAVEQFARHQLGVPVPSVSTPQALSSDRPVPRTALPTQAAVSLEAAAESQTVFAHPTDLPQSFAPQQTKPPQDASQGSDSLSAQPLTDAPDPARPAGPLSSSEDQPANAAASQWTALRHVFGSGPGATPGPEPPSPALLTVFSLAGGVGKTTLTATLGRTCAGAGDKVLLVDTTAQHLLPFYFGGREGRRGVLRTFSPPDGSASAAVRLITPASPVPGDAIAAQDRLLHTLNQHSPGMQRILVDLDTGSSATVLQLAPLSAAILIPLAPDLSSVHSLRATERLFSEGRDAQGASIEPHYVLNGFDPAQPLHLEVRDILRSRLAGRLLPFEIPGSNLFPEALAAGMTILDYAPETPLNAVLESLADWLRALPVPGPHRPDKRSWAER